MNRAELLAEIKSGLGEYSNYQDSQLNTYITIVINYMINGGVHPDVANSPAAVGCILTGVVDTRQYGAGSGKFSQLFKDQMVQLACIKPTSTTESGV